MVAHPGEYIGVDRDPTSGRASAAKIVVTALPGGGGVSLDYESFNADNPDRIRGHAEHAVLGRTHGGGSVLVTGHSHADSVAVLRESETEPGVFELGGESSSFPLSIRIEIPGPGQLVYAWSYGAPGGEVSERDRAELTLST